MNVKPSYLSLTHIYCTNVNHFLQEVNEMKKAEKKRKKKPSVASGERSAPASLFQSALFGSLCGLITSVLLLFAVTIICYRVADPEPLMQPLSLGALYLSCLVSGFAAIKRQRAAALLCGGLAGLGLLVFFLILSIFLRQAQESDLTLAHSLMIRFFMLPVACIGGFLGLGKPKRRRP